MSLFKWDPAGLGRAYLGEEGGPAGRAGLRLRDHPHGRYSDREVRTGALVSLVVRLWGSCLWVSEIRTLLRLERNPKRQRIFELWI